MHIAPLRLPFAGGAPFARVRFNKIFLFAVKIDDLAARIANTASPLENLTSRTKTATHGGIRSFFFCVSFCERARYANYNQKFVTVCVCVFAAIRKTGCFFGKEKTVR